jgi:hypothetical protein
VDWFWQWLSRLTDLGSVVGWLFAIPVAMAALRKFKAWRSVRNVRSLDAQIERVERLLKSPSARMDLMQRRVFWVFAIVGAWMMMQTVGIELSVGAKIAALAHFFCGGLIYAVALDTLRRMKDVDDGPRTLERLRQRRQKLLG